MLTEMFKSILFDKEFVYLCVRANTIYVKLDSRCDRGLRGNANMKIPSNLK